MPSTVLDVKKLVFISIIFLDPCLSELGFIWELVPNWKSYLLLGSLFSVEEFCWKIKALNHSYWNWNRYHSHKCALSLSLTHTHCPTVQLMFKLFLALSSSVNLSRKRMIIIIITLIIIRNRKLIIIKVNFHCLEFWRL